MPHDETATLDLGRAHDAAAGYHAGAPSDHAERRGPLRPPALTPTRLRLAMRQVAYQFMAADALALTLAISIVMTQTAGGLNSVVVSGVCGLAVVVTLYFFRCYRLPARRGLVRQLSLVTLAFACGASVGALGLLAVLPVVTVTDALQVWTPMAWLLVSALHTIWWSVVRRWRGSGRLTPNIVVVGATGAAERLISKILERRDANILGLFDDRADRSPPNIAGVPVLGNTMALLDHRIMPSVDRIIISVPAAARERVAQLIERLSVLPNEITLLLDGQDAEYEAAAIGRIADAPLAVISGAPSNQYRAAIKRAQDLVVGVTALLFALPIMVVVAFAIRLDSPGPILFRQRRHGFNNEEITVWKFRSMKIESADAHAHRQISANDDRVTRVGRIIRRTSLDELPQIFNVLSGQMSLVGPRPHAIGMKTGEVESSRLVAGYAHRHRMKPGMTGWAAVNGSRGPIDTPELVQTRVALDVDYIHRQSFWLDMWIMLITIPCLLGDSQAVR